MRALLVGLAALAGAHADDDTSDWMYKLPREACSFSDCYNEFKFTHLEGPCSPWGAQPAPRAHPSSARLGSGWP